MSDRDDENFYFRPPTNDKDVLEPLNANPTILA
jgi:hypothetical protein